MYLTYKYIQMNKIQISNLKLLCLIIGQISVKTTFKIWNTTPKLWKMFENLKKIRGKDCSR